MEITTTNTTSLANFHLELLEIEDKINSAEWRINVPDNLKDQWAQGVPVLTGINLEVDIELFYDVSLRVVRVCQKWQPGPQPLSDEVISLIENLEQQDKLSLHNTVIRNDNRGKEVWTKKLNITEDMMDFLIIHIARPFLASCSAEIVKQLDLDTWEKGYCPVCGDSPVMARLTGKHGIRKLHCGRCETQWRFPRVGCPFCGNVDSSKISFLSPENYKQYRLYLCEQCKSYLKTVDERHCAEVDLFCEDLATADFDRLALSEGYQRGDKRYRA